MSMMAFHRLFPQEAKDECRTLTPISADRGLIARSGNRQEKHPLRHRLVTRVRRSVTNQVVEFHVQGLGDRRQCRNGTGARRSFDLREIERADAGGLCHLLLRHAPVLPVHANRILPGKDSINEGDRKRLLVFLDRSIVKRFIGQVIVGNLTTGEALVVLPTNHSKGWAPCIITDHLRAGHQLPLSLVHVAPTADAQYVDGAGGIVSLKDQTSIPDPQAVTGSTMQTSHVQVGRVRVLCECPQCRPDAVTLSPRHLADRLYRLGTNGQLIWLHPTRIFKHKALQ